MSERTVVVLAPDLMDRSRITAALPGARVVTTLAGVEADLVVVDLHRPGVLDQLAQVRAARIIGFGSHVDADLLAAGLAAGCTEVLPRSAFFHRLPTL